MRKFCKFNSKSNISKCLQTQTFWINVWFSFVCWWRNWGIRTIIHVTDWVLPSHDFKVSTGRTQELKVGCGWLKICGRSFIPSTSFKVYVNVFCKSKERKRLKSYFQQLKCFLKLVVHVMETIIGQIQPWQTLFVLK